MPPKAVKLDIVRKRQEEWEDSSLSPYATKSAQSQGRPTPEEPDDLRTGFQRDRDRIVHSNSFRRLKRKTQVFISPQGDHFVTRLTHTVEVMQIGRTIARALRLNEDMVEAATLGHDLGHTPFGHIGEQVLDSLLPGGFRHSEQSLRTIDLLEKNGKGLNLTNEVRQAILRHSKPRGPFIDAADAGELTLEAQVTRIADAIAYLNHDIGDSIRAGVLSEDDLPAGAREVLGTRHSQRIDSMVRDVVEASWACTGLVRLPSGERPRITMTPEVADVVTELRELMFRRVYLPTNHDDEGDAAKAIVEFLFNHYCTNADQVPEQFWLHSNNSAERAITDYIAGMTDQFAVRAAEQLKPGISRNIFQGRI